MKPFAILLILGALLLGYGALSTRWFGYDGDSYSMHFGLLHAESCEVRDAIPECHQQINLSHARDVHGLRDVVMVAATTVAALAALAAAILSLLGAVRPTRTVGMLIVIACGVGVASSLAVLFGGLAIVSHVGAAALAYIGGAALAFTGGLLAMHANPAARRPMMYAGAGMMPPMGLQPGFMAPPPGLVPMTPPCNECGGQTQFVAQYGKLFCGRCNRYIV